VLGQTGHGVGFVHADLELERPAGKTVFEVAVHADRVRHHAAVFDGGPVDLGFGQGPGVTVQIQRLPAKSALQIGCPAFQGIPGQGLDQGLQISGGRRVGPGVHMVAGVDGEKGVAGVDEGGEGFRGFEMVRIRPETVAPPGFKNTPDRIRHDIGRRAARALVFPHRLLGQNRGYSCFAHSLDMPRRCQPQAIPAAGRKGGSDHLRFQKR
jgi:hypothetical protein